MKMKPPTAFKWKKLFNPCTKILQVFKLRLKRPPCIRRTHQFRRHRAPIKTTQKNLLTRLLSSLCSRKRSRKMDRVMELNSFSDKGHHKAPCPSPLTPDYVKLSGKKKMSGQDDVEDACRSFENYLVEMIVEEGKMKDLTDVEELLYCWNNLKCPVFINLVCRFYGELCKDLFSNNSEDENESSKPLR